MKPGMRKGRHSMLASYTRCKCSVETARNSVKVKPGIKEMKISGKSDRLPLFHAHPNELQVKTGGGEF